MMLGKLLHPGFSRVFANSYASCCLADDLRSLDLIWKSAEH